MDGRIDALVLGKPADDTALATLVLVNLLQVAGTDAVCDRTEIGILRNTGREAFLAAVIQGYLAEQLDLNVKDVVLAEGPVLLGGLHGIDERHHPVVADIDGDQPADRPEFGEIGLSVDDRCGNRGTRAAACHDIAQHAVARMLHIPSLARDFLIVDHLVCRQNPISFNLYRLRLNGRFRGMRFLPSGG